MEILQRVETKEMKNESISSQKTTSKTTNETKEQTFDQVIDHVNKQKEERAKKDNMEPRIQIKVDEDVHILPIAVNEISSPISLDEIAVDGAFSKGIVTTMPIKNPEESLDAKTDVERTSDHLTEQSIPDDLQTLFTLVQNMQLGNMANKQIVGETKVTEVQLDVDMNPSTSKQVVHNVQLEKQIQSLRMLVKELSSLESDSLNPLGNNLKGKEGAKESVPTTLLQGTKNGTEQPAQWSNALLKLMETSKNGEFPKNTLTKEFFLSETRTNTDEVKSDSFTGDFKQDNTMKSDTLKVSDIKEVRTAITKEVEQYVDMKIVSPKKLILQLNQGEYGKIEIHIQKMDDKIHIFLKADDKTTHEKLENMLENLKNSLKDKQINVEYEVEKENGQQEEKRKEQEEQMKKGNKEAHNMADESEVIPFDDLLGVIQ